MRTSDKYFNFHAIIHENGTKILDKCYRNVKEMCEDLKDKYSAHTVKSRCSETKRGRVFPNGLKIYRVRILVN